MVERYWQIVRKRALKETLQALLLDSRERIVIAAVVAILAVTLIWVIGGPGEAKGEILARLGGSLAILCVFPAVYLRKFCRAPAKLYAADQFKIALLEERLLPKLKIFVPPNSGFSTINWGVTTESPRTGDRQTCISSWADVLRISCTNEGTQKISDCAAYLVAAKEVDQHGILHDIGFNDSVKLSWSRNISDAEFNVDIEPGISRSIFVLVSKPAGLSIFRGREIPIEYHQIFMKPKRYRLWLQVHGGQDVGSLLVLDAWREGEPPKAFVTPAIEGPSAQRQLSQDIELKR